MPAPLIQLLEASITHAPAPGAPALPPFTLGPLSLDIPQGQFLVLAGHFNAGKSTLMRLCSALRQPTSGRVLINGEDPWSMSEPDRASLAHATFGAFQHAYDFKPDRSALDNILASPAAQQIPDAERKENALAALARMNLADQANTPTGRLRALERNKVALARALIASPAVLLADEPTATLDEPTSAALIALLAALHATGLTLIIATHDARITQKATRTITLEKGQVRTGL